MSNWFKKIIGSGASEEKSRALATSLDVALANYPPNTPPFHCDQKQLTPPKQEANLSHFLTTVDQRLLIVSDLLKRNGISVAPMLDPTRSQSEALAVTDAVNRWLISEAASLNKLLPHMQGTQMFERFRISNRAGEDIIFSLAADLALLEGEAVRRRDTRFSWQICREKHLAQTFHSKRICLIRPAEGSDTLPYVLEFEFTVVDLFYDRISGRPPLRHYGKNLAN